MPSYLHPGVYVEEVSSGSRPIEGVATSVVAFVGVTKRYSNSEPVLIGSMQNYLDKFGPILSEDDAMGLAVQAFYANGGGAAYICPLVSSIGAPASKDINGNTFKAIGEGEWGNSLYIRASNLNAGTYDLEVGTQNIEGVFYALEKFEAATLIATSDGTFVENKGNKTSSLIEISLGGTVSLPGESANGVKLDDATFNAPAAADYTTFYDSVLRKMRDVSIIVLPGQSMPTGSTGNDYIGNTISHCESMKNRLLIVDPVDTAVLDNSGDVADLSLPSSTYSALYYPWVGVSNPLYHSDRNPSANKTINIAPSAIAAGMWSKIDVKRGVWKAPAGVETQIIGASSLKEKVENLEQDQLNPLGINCIRKLPNYGTVIWGARTLATNSNPEWRYIPVRRTAIYIEESLYNGIQWAVFEPNADPLWSSLRANVGGFMNGMFRAGAFQGTKASDAYFVRCGLGDTMTQADIDRGQVIIEVGFAPLKPAEFVIVRIQQKVGEE